MTEGRELLFPVVGSGVVPIWIKLAYTIFLCVLVPAYWRHYGPANFLWFSDIALFLTFCALWLESSFLASMQAVSVALLELIWLVDFLIRLLVGREVTGITKYMFDRKNPLFIRGLSLFHVWLPALLLWLMYRLGYDRRGWLAQALVACVVLIICYCFTRRSQNINWVFGLWGEEQTRLPPLFYLIVLMAAFPLCVYLPTHLVLSAVMPIRS